MSIRRLVYFTKMKRRRNIHHHRFLSLHNMEAEFTSAISTLDQSRCVAKISLDARGDDPIELGKHIARTA